MMTHQEMMNILITLMAEIVLLSNDEKFNPPFYVCFRKFCYVRNKFANNYATAIKKVQEPH